MLGADLLGADLLRAGLLGADLPGADLGEAVLEREVILFVTLLQSERCRRRRNESGFARFKSALIGIGDIAPIRDR
ncbi:pentapeptide repeat-containing protein [Bradyrhizobium sp. AUGA SZCCT0124]|uniref:pentapeptide repeat-containing protein n=1 Tax=Bradyrhizobium sp. AUGA SZCCT0124 TaxID=2807658 RepID=UPI00390828AF